MPATIPAELLPTDDEVAHYRETGLHLTPRIIPEEVLDRALEGMERFYRGDVDRAFPGRTRYDEEDWRPEHGAGLRKNDYTSLMVDELAALVRHPMIGATAARLAGADEIRLWHDQLLYKPPSAPDTRTAVGWHTDRQYWQTCSSTDMLTAWVPLVDVDEEMGAMSLVVGSHRWPDADRGLDFFSAALHDQEATFSEGRDEVQRVSAVLRRGQVSFHHCGVIHGSQPNRTSRVRRSMAIHLQPGDNRFVSGARDRAGAPAYHRNDELVRIRDGHPDYTDPRICPVLHPSPNPAAGRASATVTTS